MFKKIISFGLLTESMKVPTRLGSNRSPRPNHLSAIHRKILSHISEENRNYPHKNEFALLKTFAKWHCEHLT